MDILTNIDNNLTLDLERTIDRFHIVHKRLYFGNINQNANGRCDLAIQHN
jgi:hypothetical protein